LWVVAGRRSGKDSIASAVAAAAAMKDYRAHLRPGERATVLCLACDRSQARIVTRYIAGYFRETPLLAPLVERETDDGIELNNGVEIVVGTNSFRAVRGRTLVCVIFDEVAFWHDEDSATPDVETYAAVSPGLITLPGAMLIAISTPYRRAGLLYERWRKFYGKADPDVLVVRGRRWYSIRLCHNRRSTRPWSATPRPRRPNGWPSGAAIWPISSVARLSMPQL
jgi:hypothetical protein